MTFKIKLLSFMTKVNLNNGKETKSDILFMEHYSNLTVFFSFNHITLISTLFKGLVKFIF